MDVSGNIQIQQKYTESGIYPAGNLTFSTNDSSHRWEVGAIEGYVKANAGSEGGYPGGLAFKTKNADNNSNTVATTKMVIDASGNVGIGTTTPDYKLDIFEDTTDTENSIRYKCSAPQGQNSKSYMRLERDGYGGAIGGGLIQGSGGVLALATIHNDGPITDHMTIRGNGNVGIGTTNPQYTLDVSGTIRATNNIYVGAHQVVTTGDTGTVSNTMLANSTISGVGLGSNLENLTAGNGISMENYNGNTERTIALDDTFTVTGDIQAGTITANSDTEGIQLGQHEIKLTNATAAHYSLVNATYGSTYNLEIRNTSSGLALGTFSSSDDDKTLMTFNSGGNVGIGTTNPQTALQITSSSGLRLTNTAIKQNANERIGYIDFNNNGYGAAIESCVGVGTTPNNSDLRFMTTYNFSNPYVERMRIDREGNVGIGANSPDYKLDIFEDTTDTESYIRYSAKAITGDGVTSTTYMRLERGNSGGSNGYGGAIGGYLTQTVGPGLVLATINNGTINDHMTIRGNGYVGIGTTNPQYTLDVSGSVSAQKGKSIGHVSYFGNMAIGDLGFNNHAGIAFHRSTTYDTSFALLQTSGGATILNSSSGQNIAFNVGNLNKMTITSGGKVGIGTNSPDYPLEVQVNSSLEYSITSGFAFWHNMTIANSDVIHYSSSVYDGATSNQDFSPATSILAHGAIVSKHGFWADSDSRIKTNIIDMNDDSALTTLRQIQPKIYEYKDKLSRGNHTVYGFIAQQIKELLPKAITLQSRPVPSIYEFGQVTSSSSDNFYDTITFTTFNTADLDTSSNTLIVVDDTSKRHSVNITAVIDSSSVRVDTDLSEWMGAVDASGNVTRNEVQTYEKVILDASNNVILENYDIEPIASMDASDASDASENVVGKMADLTGDNTIDSSGNYVDASGNTIAAINADGHYIDASGNFFDTDGNLKDASGSLIGTYKAEWKNVIIHGTTTFVYGQEVDDFHVLQKEYIFTVATAALQEVDRQLQAEKVKVSTLESDLTAEKAKTATLESQMADLLARVSALESA